MSIPLPVLGLNTASNALVQPIDPKQKADREALERKFFDLVAAGNVDEMRTCLEQTPDLIGIQGFWDVTPLHKPVQHLQLDALRLLCKYGANLNAKDKSGMTPVHYLAEQRQRADQTGVEATESDYESILQALNT